MPQDRHRRLEEARQAPMESKEIQAMARETVRWTLVLIRMKSWMRLKVSLTLTVLI